MQTYSPFNKPIRDLESSDLLNLKHTFEGWYIEYKREAPTSTNIAKSLSALANTYGGWFFVGIDEDSKENPVAGAFPGVERNEVDAVLQRMRKSAADHINPTPYFETKVLWGPVEKIGLEKDRCVICTWVPQSVTAPHVHKSGVIYRRVSDASEPKPENDRFVLDQLWRRADDIKQQHKKWYDRDPEFSDYEKLKPYVRVMLVADRWAEQGIWIDANEDEIRSVLATLDGASTIPFDTVHTSAEGFIGRQLNGNDPNNLSLTWRLGLDLVSDIIIPLPLYEVETIQSLKTELDGYDYTDRFIGILNKYAAKKYRIVDLNYLFNVLRGVAEIQERLCKIAKWTDAYYVKVKILNAWRTVPFLDILPVVERFEKNGPPMCLDSVISLPQGSQPESYTEVSRFRDIEIDESERAKARVLLQAFTMFSNLALSLGIPRWIPCEEGVEVSPFHQELEKAGLRAIEVQRRRNERGSSAVAWF
ncbi:helix-turn-helix domain-containing protein [Methylomonas sp. ZR1]|uniref:AlbA family DNA-binding domain-containing protein n=1 Tax=Methylomonas sp. ZR1 TaxID=1797072 RepID=UPI001491C981|nr:ATP-binding protein [Methylomonas sp. ZR1]NOV31915.1 ATP-binding protein [Methylomonas sp. ZR1]